MDMVFAGDTETDTGTNAEAYAKEKGWSLTDFYCCPHETCSPTNYHSNLGFSSSSFDLCLIQKYLPSVTIPALTAAETTGVHVVFHADPPTLRYRSVSQNHSIVLKPGPEGWIHDLYKFIAKSKLISAAPVPRPHGIYQTTTITYDGTYHTEVYNVTDLLNPAHKVIDPRQAMKDSLYRLKCAKLDAEWLLDYRRFMGTDLKFEFEYKKFERDYQMECSKCTAVMRAGTIKYRCHCPPITLDSIDETVAHAKKMYNLK